MKELKPIELAAFLLANENCRNAASLEVIGDVNIKKMEYWNHFNDESFESYMDDKVLNTVVFRLWTVYKTLIERDVTNKVYIDEDANNHGLLLLDAIHALLYNDIDHAIAFIGKIIDPYTECFEMFERYYDIISK